MKENACNLESKNLLVAYSAIVQRLTDNGQCWKHRAYFNSHQSAYVLLSTGQSLEHPLTRGETYPATKSYSMGKWPSCLSSLHQQNITNLLLFLKYRLYSVKSTYLVMFCLWYFPGGGGGK